MCIHCNCSLIKSLSLYSFKVCLCVIVFSVTICTVGYVCSFCKHQIFMDIVSFLSMIIYEVLYTLLSWCVRYTICSAWFIDIRIWTCLLLGLKYPFTIITLNSTMNINLCRIVYSVLYGILIISNGGGSTYVTGFRKTDSNCTFGILRITNLKYLTHCESLLLGCSHAIFAV